ncbi:hypothetical protein RhiirA1_542611 [Rhizophagus irregularis]|uniref:Uncharacterized protein n=1 Tax=Rhizophagus irregularis TaxID=588596 RepID=A0A2N0QVW4_9GLOM|nr:hypothetical protein RhiirA1_542611 [Rhizophagus irregularis]
MASGITVDEKNIGDDTKEVKDYITDLSNKFSSTVAKVSAMNKTMEKFMSKSSYNQKKIDNMFQVHPLKLSNYERDDSKEPQDQSLVQDQVTIFKELHNWQNIVHRDISVVNIFITLNETAKLANFKLSRLTALALIQVQNLERVRYCAPKWLERAPNFNYDYKLCNKMYREPFSENSQMSEEFKQLQFEDYSKRPSASLIPTPKRAYSIDQDAHALPSNLPDFKSFKYMTLTDAAKQHKLCDRKDKLIGDIITAYKCFEAYANLGGTRFVESPPNKDKIVAELSKEVADDEANEFPEAKLRYGDCLYHGKEALKYFEKLPKMVLEWQCITLERCIIMVLVVKDIEKAKDYMKLAAYNCDETAIKFCMEHNL